MFGNKNNQYDIVDFTMKDGKVQKSDFVSRTKEVTYFPASYKDMVVFCDYSDTDYYNVYVTSSSDEFKKINNINTKSDFVNVVFDVLHGLINAFVYLFVYGARWILFGLLFIAILTLFNYAFKESTKYILFTLAYASTSFIKLYYLYQVCYKSLNYRLPTFLSNRYIGMSILLFFSLLCFSYGIRRFSKDLEAMPIGSFMLALGIDTLLTQLLFIPFLV